MTTATESFAKTIADAYAFDGRDDRPRPRRPRRDARARRGRPPAARDDEPARPDRRRHRHGQDEDGAGARRAALGRRRLRLRRRLQGRPVRAPRAGAGRRPGARRACRISACRSSRPASRSSSCRSAGSGSGVPIRATVTDFGPQLLAKVLGANETQEASLALLYPLRRRARPAARRPRRPARAADLLRQRRGQGRPEGHRRRLEPDDRRAPPLARRARGRRRQRVLRRAAVRDRRPARGSTRRPRDHLVPRAAGGAGQAEALLDRPDVAARGAVRAASRGRRPRQAEARLLLRRGAPALRRGDGRVPGVGRADGADDPLEGRRRLLRARRRRPTCRASVLAQLGNRIQHALRAFTPEDADALRKTVRTYPTSEFYDLESC